ncbi:MAG: DUF1080 domain-containing protein, partial [Planctomycetes bacterium]|nr:DUF1080 domain-containing protein [Planctomycetota bacterium]
MARARSECGLQAVARSECGLQAVSWAYGLRPALQTMQEGTGMPESASGPSKIGGFELLGRLGKGGMGTVLKARQVSMDRLVALKILPKKLAENEAFVQRFLREARSAAKLRHPNIVQAHDVGQAEGYYFFAMEFVDGETLADIVRRDGPLEPNRALDVMKQVCSALAAAHKEGIVHRDIKPANIMLDKEAQVRVTDFGLAKRTEGDVAVTADGAVVGTPAYVAPEMAKGGEADARSDLYSLGATIFCALAGRPPFEGKNFSEVLIKQVNEAAPPLASLAPRVDRRLCHVVDRLLRKNPEARYPSATALLDDLNGLGKLQSVAAAARAEARAMLAEAPTLEMTEGRRQMADGRRQTAARQPKSNRTILIAVAAIVAIIAIAAVVLVLRSGRKPADRAVTIKPSTSSPTRPSTPSPIPSPKVPSSLKPTTEHPIPPKVKDLPKKPEPPVPPAPQPGEWVSLFDGRTLEGWKVADGSVFEGHGTVTVEDGLILLGEGKTFTGGAWTKPFPRTGYEVAMQVQRFKGREAGLCNIVLPVGKSGCILSVGGFGGAIVGLTFVDGQTAEKNVTRRRMAFDQERWYDIRLRVTTDKVEAWVGDEQVVDLPLAEHELKLPGGYGALEPFGVYAERSGRTALRNIRLLRLHAAAAADAKQPELAKWEAIKAEAKKLVGAGKFDEAVKVLRTGQNVAIEGIGDMIDAEIELAEAARKRAAAAALAAYQAESDKLWALFKARDYPAAEKLLADVARRSAAEIKGVRPAGAEDFRVGDADSLAQHLKADQEAAKLLREFWAAVEKGVAARKGTVSIRGAVGNITAVDKGVITIQTPKGEAIARSLHDLDAKQALAYAAVVSKDDERSRLAEAIFRIAEGEDPALAEKALAAAGKPPGLSYYHDRLAALTLGAAEVAARKAWAEIEAAAEPKPTKAEAARILALLDAFEKAHAGTKHFAAVRDKLPDLREKIGAPAEAVEPPPPPADVPPERAGEIGLEQGFVAAYYAGRDHDRFVTAEAAKQRLSFNWDTKAPAPGVPADNFSCRFVGWLCIDEPGEYAFAFWHDDGVRLYLDGKSVVDYWVAKPGHSPAGKIQLEKGWHRLWVEHFDGPWTATITLLWRKGQAAETNVPADVLYCESELLERVRRHPTRNPLLGMKPTDGGRLPKPKPRAGNVETGEWQSLFDGKTLKGWNTVQEFPGYGGSGRVEVQDAQIILERAQGTGITWSGGFPSVDYEVIVQAMRLGGTDSMLTICFPSPAGSCQLGVGGWKNEFVGLEKVDGKWANENSTGKRMRFEDNRWYEVRLVVARGRVEAWLDGTKVVDLATAGHVLSLPPAAERIQPFGMYTWRCKTAVRSVRLRRIEPEAAEAPRAGEWPFDAAEARRRQSEAAKALGVEAETDIALGGGVKMTLVLIPAGEFLMGSAPATSPEQLQKVFGGNAGEFQPEFPQRRVKISKPFWLGKTEVTQAQWQAVMGENPSHFKGKPQNPVDNVSWDDCQGFLQKLSAKFKRPFRLPTEA